MTKVKRAEERKMKNVLKRDKNEDMSGEKINREEKKRMDKDKREEKNG